MSLHTLNPETTNTKIEFIKSHLDQTHIIADFDGTLTKYFDEVGKARWSIISLLRHENILDEEYSQLTKAMYAKYSVIEHDDTLPLEERQNAMVEWRESHEDLLMKKWLNIKHIELVMGMDKMPIRSWVETLLRTAHEKNIPVIIFSASGIGTDSIEILLNHWNLNLPNISIVSNKLYRDEQWNMTWYSKPVIHWLNKTESILQSPEYAHIQQYIAWKSHTILLWDGIWDATMAIEKEWKTVLKIWLCNDKVEERLENYEKLFDLVLTHDDWLDEIIEKIL